MLGVTGPQGGSPHQVRDEEQDDGAGGDQKLTQAADDGSHGLAHTTQS
jgi:hypothetical protein